MNNYVMKYYDQDEVDAKVDGLSKEHIESVWDRMPTGAKQRALDTGKAPANTTQRDIDGEVADEYRKMGLGAVADQILTGDLEDD